MTRRKAEPLRCPNCAGDMLSWASQYKGNSVSGVEIFAVLGCEQCLSVVKVRPADHVLSQVPADVKFFK